jgi:hypothetical protein
MMTKLREGKTPQEFARMLAEPMAVGGITTAPAAPTPGRFEDQMIPPEGVIPAKSGGVTLSEDVMRFLGPLVREKSGFSAFSGGHMPAGATLRSPTGMQEFGSMDEAMKALGGFTEEDYRKLLEQRVLEELTKKYPELMKAK